MWSLQHILAYLTVALAVVYLLRKFVFPSIGRSRKSNAGGDCGSPDCGCH